MTALKFGLSLFYFNPGRGCAVNRPARPIFRKHGFFWKVWVFSHDSSRHTDPHVYIRDDRTPKHTITDMFCTLDSRFKYLIWFIFSSLDGSKANMLNLFKAFQSDDGKASGIVHS